MKERSLNERSQQLDFVLSEYVPYICVVYLLNWSKNQETLQHYKWLSSNIYRKKLPFGHHLQILCHHLLQWPHHWSSDFCSLQITMEFFHKVQSHYLHIQIHVLNCNHYHLSQIVSLILPKEKVFYQRTPYLYEKFSTIFVYTLLLSLKKIMFRVP